jgi:hypothetical protein
VKRREEVRDVRQVERDPIARFDPVLRKRRREAARPRPEVTIGNIPTIGSDRRCAGVVFGRSFDVGDEVRYACLRRYLDG